MKRQYLLTIMYVAKSDGKVHELVFLCDKYPDLPDNAANELLAKHLDEEFLLTDYEVKELERPLIDTTKQDKLSERAATLLLEGARMEGTMTGGYSYAEEQLYVDEAPKLLNFCKWIDEKVGGCSIHNIYTLYDAWQNPSNETLQNFVRTLKARIDEIKEYTKK